MRVSLQFQDSAYEACGRLYKPREGYKIVLCFTKKVNIMTLIKRFYIVFLYGEFF